MKAVCKICYHYDLCKAEEHDLPEYLNCNFFKCKNDVVEVVRCKECKHNRYIQPGSNIVHCKRNDKDGLLFRKLDDYCSYGERRCDNE